MQQYSLWGEINIHVANIQFNGQKRKLIKIYNEN